MTLILHGIIKFALSIAESFKNIHCRNMCELFKSDGSPLKKSWRKLETVCPCIFLRAKVFANFNTSAYFSFIPSLRNIANVVLGSINWFSFEKVVFVMCMRLKMMFLFPKIMWFFQRDSCERDYPKNCNISLSNNIQRIWVAFSKTVWSFGCKEIVRIAAYLKIAKKQR